MSFFPAIFLVVAFLAGPLLAGMLAWMLLVAVIRLVLALHTRETVSVLLTHLAEASPCKQRWEPVLHSLRLLLPWPWPWRLARAADRLAAGQEAAEVLATSSLLPQALRTQAAQALRQGHEAFGQWCRAIIGKPPATAQVVRQQAFLLAEATAMLVVLHFMAFYIAPKFEMICRDLNVHMPMVINVLRWLADWEWPVLLVIIALVAASGAWMLSRHWRRCQRHAAARLLLAGSQAHLPEAALGDQASFPALCRASGWQADTPAALARALAQEERCVAQRNAWLPSTLAAVAPVVAAIPVGLIVIGFMHAILSILYRVEAAG